MDFTNLLSATIRLSDTYDLGRTPGLGNTQVSIEEKRKNTNGLWFHLATTLIQYLHKKDLAEPMAYHSIEPLVSELIGDLDVFDLDDVRFLVNFLAKESSLKFYDSEVTELKATTPLIDKKTYGYGCRLSPNGFNTISLALTAEELLYGDQIALQIKKALELGDFDNYLIYAERLINTINSQTLEVATLLEQAGQDQLRRRYHNTSKDYLDTLDAIQETSSEIRFLLSAQKLESKMSEFLLINPDKDFYEHLLHIKIDQIQNALVSFRKNLAQLVSAFYKFRDNPIPTTDFHQMSVDILTDAIPDNSIEPTLSIYGAWGASGYNSLPTLDIFEKLPVPQKRVTKVVRFDPHNTVLHRSKIEVYVERHISEIMGAISKNGYFSLADALNKKEIFIENIDDITSLIGVCLCPANMKEHSNGLVVSFDNKCLKTQAIGTAELKFNDIILKQLSHRI